MFKHYIYKYNYTTIAIVIVIVLNSHNAGCIHAYNAEGFTAVVKGAGPKSALSPQMVPIFHYLGHTQTFLQAGMEPPQIGTCC